MSKTAKTICLEETRALMSAEFREAVEPTACTVAEKIEEFVLKLGYSNAQALSVIVQLLTRGKVRVDFRDYSQRLQVVSQTDLMPRAEAVAIFDNYLAELENRDDSASMEFTQKIMIQAPRRPAG
jgi:hypothetical protein